MAISPTDPYYQREETPDTIKTIGTTLCHAYGVTADHFGAKGNMTHYTGYHRSRDYILNSSYSTYGSRDYSVIQAQDQGGDPRDVSAFDFTPAVWGTADNRNKMMVLTKRLLAAAQASDPRLANLREFAGTLDGKTVVTYDLGRHTFKSPFDSSHLDHIHGSIWRSRAATDHAGILSVMLGGDMALEETNASYQALIWRMDALTYGRDKVLSGPMAGETMWAVVALKMLISKADLAQADIDKLEEAAAAGFTDEELKAIMDAAEKGAASGATLTPDELTQAAFEGAQRAEDE
jgi:hypothetical protein